MAGQGSGVGGCATRTRIWLWPTGRVSSLRMIFLRHDPPAGPETKRYSPRWEYPSPASRTLGGLIRPHRRQHHLADAVMDDQVGEAVLLGRLAVDDHQPGAVLLGHHRKSPC